MHPFFDIRLLKLNTYEIVVHGYHMHDEANTFELENRIYLWLNSHIINKQSAIVSTPYIIFFKFKLTGFEISFKRLLQWLKEQLF